jgi:hypothetical protein
VRASHDGDEACWTRELVMRMTSGDDDDLLEQRKRSDWRMRPRYDLQPERRERTLDTDLMAAVETRLASERRYLLDVMTAVVAELL